MSMATAVVMKCLSEKVEKSKARDTVGKKKVELLMKKTCIQKLNSNSYVFFKHFASTQRGVIYQLILGGEEFDGIYEFKMFGKDIGLKYGENKLGKCLEIDSSINFDLAEFDIKDVTTVFKRKNDVQFKGEMNTLLRECISYTSITFTFNDGKVQTVKHNSNEVKYKGIIRNILKEHFNDIKEVSCFEKKKKHYVSKIDLGEEEFKRELLELGLVTKEEYKLFTNFSNEDYNIYKEDFTNIEII